MSFDTPPAPATTAAPAPPPMFGQVQGGGKKKAKGQQPTALSEGSVPQVTALGNKTLLGA